MLIDTHAHIDFEEFENLPEVINRASKNGVEKVIIPGVEPSGFAGIIKNIETYPQLYGAIGVHPSEAKTFTDKVEQRLFDLAQNPKIVAIGEIGLDYYWDKSFVELQKEVFIRQIEIANKLQKSIIVHEREAHKDSFDILKKYAKTTVIMHCFSGSPEFAKMCTDEGYFVSFGGIITFKNAKNPKAVVQSIDINNILLETDSPYLTPEPHRGTRNEPSYVKLVAEQVAHLKQISFEDVSLITTQNAIKAFHLEI